MKKLGKFSMLFGGTCALLLSLTGCGSDLTYQSVSDKIFGFEKDSKLGDQVLSFSSNGTGEILRLPTGEKIEDFTYMIKKNDDSYKVYFCLNPGETVDVKINNDDRKNDKVTIRLNDEKLTLLKHDKDYVKTYKEEQIEKEKKEAKSLVEDKKYYATGTNGNGTISFEDGDDISESMISIKGNDELSEGKEVEFTIDDEELDTELYSGDITVPKLMPTDPSDIKNISAIKDVLKKSLEEAAKNHETEDSSSDDSDDDKKKDKKKDNTPVIKYFYNTRRGTFAAVLRKDDQYYEIETNKLSMKDNGDVDMDRLKAPESYVNTLESADSIRTALEDGVLDDGYSSYSDFIEVK